MGANGNVNFSCLNLLKIIGIVMLALLHYVYFFISDNIKITQIENHEQNLINPAASLGINFNVSIVP